jgi:hypothetical protein
MGATRKSTKGQMSARSGRCGPKNLLVDQRKLERVKRELNASTETEAVDATLDEIAFQSELVHGIRALRRAGGLSEVFDRR